MIDPERLLTTAPAVRITGTHLPATLRRHLGAGVRIGAAQIERDRRGTSR